MSIKVVNTESLLKAKRQGSTSYKVPFTLNGKTHYATKNVVNGEMDILDLTKPIGEMIVTDAGRRELLEKVVLDVELGREQVPILYTPIYERLEDSNFPEVFEAKWTMHGTVVFLQHFEGEEVKFGHLEAEQGPIARIVTYAAGIEYTEDMVEYNRTFDMELLDRAFGEGYNALLNHIHFAPILTYTYGEENKTAARYVKADGTPVESAVGAHPVLSLRETLKAGVSASRIAKRPGNILLIAGSREDHIREALGGMTVNGTVFPSLTGIDTIIAYDGYEIRVGKKTYTYGGVPEDKAYLIRPRRGFKELIKHDLRIDATMADLSRLVESQIVGRARRGVFSAVPENVQEITLPDFSDIGGGV